MRKIAFLFIVVFIFWNRGNAQSSKGKDEILSYIPNEDKGEVEFGWKVPTKEAIITFLKRLPEISTQEWHTCYGSFQSKNSFKLLVRPMQRQDNANLTNENLIHQIE